MLGEDPDNPYQHTVVLHWAAIIHLLRGELALAEDLLRKSLNLCAERGFPIVGAFNTVFMGLLAALRGQAQAGLEQICRGSEILAANSATFRQGPQYVLALGYALAGKPDEAFATLEEALKWAERSGAEFWLASMHLLKGHLFQGGANWEEAEKFYRTSIEIARRQNAKSLELRATTSLARLLAKQGECEEARNMLSEIYGWFTEGSDTADLKEAKTLLDELNT